MQKKTSLVTNFLCKFVLLIVLLLPVFSWSQEKKSPKAGTGYGAASYSVYASEQYMSDWLIAGPVSVDTTGTRPSDETQLNFFKEDLQPVTVSISKPVTPFVYRKKNYPWKAVNTTVDIVDLDAEYPGTDFAAIFALAEIKSEKEVKTFLSVGSDDGIRIWHNGRLIHDNWTPRGVVKDQDLVPITLKPGSNQLVLKVQDMSQGWGFVVRLLNKNALVDHLITAAGKGDQEQITQLLDAGANIDGKNSSGLAPLSNARLSGQEQTATLLLSKGAKEVTLPSVEALVEGLYNSLDGKNAPGISVLIAKDGKVVVRKSLWRVRRKMW